MRASIWLTNCLILIKIQISHFLTFFWKFLTWSDLVWPWSYLFQASYVESFILMYYSSYFCEDQNLTFFDLYIVIFDLLWPWMVLRPRFLESWLGKLQFDVYIKIFPTEVKINWLPWVLYELISDSIRLRVYTKIDLHRFWMFSRFCFSNCFIILNYRIHPHFDFKQRELIFPI